MSSNLSKKEEVMSSISIQKLMKCELFGDVLEFQVHDDTLICLYAGILTISDGNWKSSLPWRKGIV